MRYMASHDEIKPESEPAMIAMQLGAIAIRNARKMDITTFTELQILAAMVYKTTREYRQNESASEVATDELLTALARPECGMP